MDLSILFGYGIIVLSAFLAALLMVSVTLHHGPTQSPRETHKSAPERAAYRVGLVDEEDEVA